MQEGSPNKNFSALRRNSSPSIDQKTPINRAKTMVMVRNAFNIKLERTSIDINKRRINNLTKANDLCTHKERIKKAVRHFYDSLRYKMPRSDFESIKLLNLVNKEKLVYIAYIIQSSDFFNGLLFFVSLFYTILSFWEQANQRDFMFNLQPWVQELELSFIALYMFDIILHIYHYVKDTDRKPVKDDKKIVFKTVFISIIAVEAISYHASYPHLIFRYGRFFRPFLVLFYNRELRRMFYSIVLSLQSIFQLVVFVIVVTMIAALIATQLIGDMDGTVEYNYYNQNFNDFFITTNLLYTLITFDCYPDFMLPAIQYSQVYLAFFIPYTVLLFMILLPIPVAIVFEAFRLNRCQLALADRIKQREALLACFVCMANPETRLMSYKCFYEFMSEVYFQKKSYQKRIKSLFQHLDNNENGFVSINEFFDLIECIERDSYYQPPAFRDWELWNQFRKYVNTKLKIKAIVKGKWFQNILFAVLTVNVTAVIANLYLTDPLTTSIVETIDSICLGIYCLEFAMKLVGLGVNKYFENSWNVFDFSMIILSFFSLILQTSLSILRSAKSVKSSRILKITKLNRIFKGFRSFKALSFFLDGVQLFIQVKQLISKILLCVPMIVKLSIVIWIVFYIWAILGMEIFDTDTYNHKMSTSFNQYTYADFTSFSKTLLLLFQIAVESGWSQYIYTYTDFYNNFALCVFYFCGFHFFIQLILISLVKGIIWEIFIVVQEKLEALQEAENIAEEKKAYADSLKLLESKTDISSLNNTNVQAPIQLNDYDQILLGVGQESLSQIRQEQNSINLNEVTLKYPDLIERQESEPLRGYQNDSEKFQISNNQSSQDDGTTIHVNAFNFNTPIIQNSSKPNIIILPPLEEQHDQTPGFNRFARILFKKLKPASQSTEEPYKAYSEDDVDGVSHYAKAIVDCIFENQVDQEESHVNDEDEYELNQNFIMKQALLKDLDNDIIKKNENEYFSEHYGTFFQVFGEVNYTKLLRYQALLLESFANLIYFRNVEPKLCFKGIFQIEKQISESLLREGSLFKLVFQDSQDNWLTFTHDGYNPIPLLLNSSVWDAISLTINNSEYHSEIHVCQDVMFTTGKSQGTREFIWDLNKIRALMFEDPYQFSRDQVTDFYVFDQNLDDYEHEFMKVKKAIVFTAARVGLADQGLDDISKKSRKKASVDFNTVKKQSVMKGPKIGRQQTLSAKYIIRMMQTIQNALKLKQNNLSFITSEALKARVEFLQRENRSRKNMPD